MSNIKLILSAVLFAIGVTPILIMVSWFNTYWSIAILAVALFSYYKFITFVGWDLY